MTSPPHSRCRRARRGPLQVLWDVRSAEPHLAVAPPLGCIAGQTLVIGRHVAAELGEGVDGWVRAIERYVPDPDFAGVIVIDLEEPDPRSKEAQPEILAAIAAVRARRPRATVGVYGPYQCRFQAADLVTSSTRQAKQLANNGIRPVFAASSAVFPPIYTPDPVNGKYTDPSRDELDLEEFKRLGRAAAGQALEQIALVSPFARGMNLHRLPTERFVATLRAVRVAGCRRVMVWGWIGAGDVRSAQLWREAVPLIAQAIEESKVPAKLAPGSVVKVTTPPAIARKGKA